MFRQHGRLHEIGSVLVAIVATLTIGMAALQLYALAYINDKWPPVSLEQIQQESVSRNSAALNHLDSPNVVLQVGASSVQTWLAPEIQNAVRKFNASQQKLQLSIDTVKVSFENQRGTLSGDFQLHLIEQALTLTGSIEGYAYLALDGATVTVRPSLSKLKLRNIKSDSDKYWWLGPLKDLIYTELLLVRDNINGQLPVYSQQLKIAPLTLPGEPRPSLPVVFPDPFHPNTTITRKFVPPVLKGAVVLADADHLTVLGQLSLTNVNPPAAMNGTDDFLVYRREFRSRLDKAGLVVDPSAGVAFDVAKGFVDELFRQFMGQVFTRDRVTAAVQASYQTLSQLTHPDVGISVETPTVRKVVDESLRKTLTSWASRHSGSVVSSTFDIRQQYFWAGASAEFDIAHADARVEASVEIAVPVAGTASGLRLYPAIDQLTVKKLKTSHYGDLAGLLRGVNTFLAGAVAAANSAMQPLDVGLAPLKLGTIDFRTMISSPGTSVSPQTYAPPAMQLSNAALLLDEKRIMAMAGTGPASAPLKSPAPVDFDTYRNAYHARWAESFGSPAQPGTAHVYVKTAAIAQYINTAVNDAQLALAASVTFNDRNTVPLEIGHIPRVSCRGLINCPECSWRRPWNCPLVPPCEAANLAVRTACNVALEPTRWAINEMTRILGRHLGDLETDARGAATLQARNIRIDLSPDMSGVNLTLTAQAQASASADLRFHSKSVSGRLVCPLDFHHHVPFPSGSIHGQVPPQQLGLRATIQTRLEAKEGGGQRFTVEITPQNDIHFVGDLDTQPYAQLRLVMLSMNIQCPVTGVINILVPGLGTALSLLDIGQITALVTDTVAQSALDGLPSDLKLLYLGKINRTLDKPGPMQLAVDIPAVRVGDMTLTMQPEIKDGLLRLHVAAP